MNEWLFIFTAALFFSLLIILGGRFLLSDRFQILATVPVRRREDGHWYGVNFTWYGLVHATVAIIGILFILILIQAAWRSIIPVLVLLLLMVGLCVPAPVGLLPTDGKETLHLHPLAASYFVVWLQLLRSSS